MASPHPARPLALFLAALTGCVTTGPGATAPSWVKDARPAPSLAGKRVLFVAGYLNELIPGYFDDNVAVVEGLGAKAERLFPVSEETFDDDAAAVVKAVEGHQGPTWLVGHSKGGAAVLLAALRNPRLVLDGRVEAVVVVQGAVLGSPVADRYDADPLLGKKGLHALTRHAAEAVFSAALEELRSRLSPAEQAALFARIFYVRSRVEGAAVAAELSATKAYLDQFGPNDGLLLAESMRLAPGVDLGVLDSDHAGLVLSSFLTSSTPERRRGFTNALCREVSRQLASARR